MPYTPTHDAIARVNPLKEFPSSVIVERALGRRKLGMGGPEGHCYMSAVRRVRSVSLRTHLFRCQPTYLLKACGTLKPTTCVSTKEEQKIRASHSSGFAFVLGLNLGWPPAKCPKSALKQEPNQL